MDRRTLLKLVAAVSVAGCSKRKLPSRRFRVVVAGAGIVGASIAYHLAAAGARVTVIDRQGPASHASRGTFAWINATWAKQPRHYHAMNQDSVTSWRTLQERLDLPVRWGGSLEWFESAQRQSRLASQIAEQADWGEPARMVDRDEIAVMEPAVEFGSVEAAAFSGHDGAVDPVIATHRLLSAAVELGAELRFPSELIDVSLSGDHLQAVVTTDGRLAADRLVLATGADPDAAARFAATELPQRSRPGVIAITMPRPRVLNRVIAAPGVHMHQRGDRRIVLGEQAGAPDTAVHAARLNGRPNDFPSRDIALEHAERMRAIAIRYLPSIEAAEFDDVYIGWRPIPLDGHPVLGFSPQRPDVYLAVMHSGVTLAPIVGQLAAMELAGQRAVDRLDAYRPGRSFERTLRY